MLRILFYLIVVLSGTAFCVVAQNTETENEWELLRTEVQTRMGKIRIGDIPDTIEFDHPRFYSDFKTGRFNRWLAPKLDAPNSRFRLVPEQIPEQKSPSDFLSAEKPDKPVVSANIPAPADTSSPSQPLRRLPGFFERPGILDSTALPEENRTKPRWFRDPVSHSGLPGLNPKPQNLFGGDAIAVGGELLQNQPAPNQPTPNSPNSQNSVTETNFRTDPVVRQTVTRNQSLRHFEQKLEGMLLSDPSVHFLSPVQISFQNGIVSVRGVVTNQESKIAAGKVLLTDPAVKQVNNLISVVPL
ncbi:MAG: BON domain-containing protein [Planctomycetaceae bacterium]|jgi:hypothetical protein|nr:BON domain-containing protein [Planctomycetaceae bacterium]